MPQYKEKSHEEVRWENYRLGYKGGPNPASQQPAGASPFSQPAQSSLFGQTTSTFRQTTSSYGQTSVAHPFLSSLFRRAAFGTSFGSAFSTHFGASSSTSQFGAQSTTPTLCISGFGHIPFWEQQVGSKSMPYTNTNEADGGVGGQAPGKLISISAMPHYKLKSHEELRWEDYQLVINPAFVSSSMPTFGLTSGASRPAIGASSTSLLLYLVAYQRNQILVIILHLAHLPLRTQLNAERGRAHESFSNEVVVRLLLFMICITIGGVTVVGVILM